MTIQELIDFGKTAGDGDQKSFADLPAVVAKAEAPKQGEYGQMQRVQLKDDSGAWFFTAMDCADLAGGEQILASGVVKGNPPGKNAYFNVRSYQPASFQPPAQQAPASGGRRASGPAAGPRTVRQAVKMTAALVGESEGWGLKSEETRQALISTILIAWSKGDLVAGGPPERRPPSPPPPEPEPEEEYSDDSGYEDADIPF